jgi:hypothetical protein
MVQLESMKIMSRGMRVFFIQKLSRSSTGKRKSMPSPSARLVRHMSPRVRESRVAATSAFTACLPP